MLNPLQLIRRCVMIPSSTAELFLIWAFVFVTGAYEELGMKEKPKETTCNRFQEAKILINNCGYKCISQDLTPKLLTWYQQFMVEL